jgi:hypothetical protein
VQENSEQGVDEWCRALANNDHKSHKQQDDDNRDDPPRLMMDSEKEKLTKESSKVF